MVSQDQRAAASRDRLLAAAAAEFAARGFAGAKVDRIAAKARLNKAMIYYHFDNKTALYREILVGVFSTIADAVAAVPDGGTPEDQVRLFVRAVAHEAWSRPHFAPMWLREMADGGGHVDAAVVGQLRRVLQVLNGIIARGVARGVFHPVHPLVVQLGIVGPLLMFAVSAPVRARFARHGEQMASPERSDVLKHIEAAAIGALTRDGAVAQTERPSARGQRT
jgi:TetR/AcrR family transcriptional regulator